MRGVLTRLEKSFFAGAAAPQTPLGELVTLRRPPSRLGDTPFPGDTRWGAIAIVIGHSPRRLRCFASRRVDADGKLMGWLVMAVSLV